MHEDVANPLDATSETSEHEYGCVWMNNIEFSTLDLDNIFENN